MAPDLFFEARRHRFSPDPMYPEGINAADRLLTKHTQHPTPLTSISNRTLATSAVRYQSSTSCEEKMKNPVVIYRADLTRRVASGASILAGCAAFAIGMGIKSFDVQVMGLLVVAGSAINMMFCDSILIDGRRNLITRRRGLWPVLADQSKPFSDVDHVAIDQTPGLDPDGIEYVVSSLSLVRKSGPPIVLANTDRESQSFLLHANSVAKLIGVEARANRRDMKGFASLK